MTTFIDALNPVGLPVLLIVAVFIASMLQAVTGIGFGVIAGPVLLVTMASAGAIQVSIVLSFLIALVLAPITIPRVQQRLLKPLFIGVCLGSPLGAIAFLTVSLETLKIIAACVVGFMTLVAAGVLSRYPMFEVDTKSRRVGVGAISGFLNTTLAMPGPPIAAYATATKSDKATIQATTLVTFLLAYPVAFAAQTFFIGISADALAVTLRLLVPTLGGVLAGLAVGSLLPNVLFRLTTIIFLSLSVFMLVQP
jgi:uncharacterized membrane protein YfcA